MLFSSLILKKNPLAKVVRGLVIQGELTRIYEVITEVYTTQFSCEIDAPSWRDVTRDTNGSNVIRLEDLYTVRYDIESDY